MPRDSRLYMTFPNDFHRHPKLTRLPVDVRWTFIEMNGEARIADNDGRFSAEDAEFMWPIEHLDALAKSHPTRPLVIREKDGGDYVIREYAEHQQTREERERLAEVSRENGRKGGRPRKNPEGTQAKPGQVPTGTQPQPSGTQSKAESESESEDFFSPSKSQSRNNRASVSTDSIEVSEMTRRLAAQKGIKSLRVVVDSIQRHTGLTVDAAQAYQVCEHLLAKAKTFPDAPQRYVLSCIEQSPLEVQKHIHEAVA
jgi:hypothetical protein